VTDRGGPEPSPPPAVEVPAAGDGRRNLPIAIASGLLLAGLMLVSLFWHPLAFTALVVALCLLALLEAGRVLRTRGIVVAVPVLLATALVMLLGTYQGGTAGQALGVLTLFLGGVAWQLADGVRSRVFPTLAATMLLGLWVPFLASYGVLLVTRPDDGPVATLAVLGGAIFTDVGAYAVGVRLGRHKIAPRISPAKSWEGLVGGLVTAGVAGAIALPLLSDRFDLTTAVVLPVLVGLAGFFGDLTESMLKRDLGLKDLGAIIPGHGGVLDRVDGILLALPVGYYALEVLA
jgi:phosphatidate cytidylyltransferase